MSHGLCVPGATRQGWEDHRVGETSSRTQLPASRVAAPATCNGRHLWGEEGHAALPDFKKIILFLMLSWETSAFFPQIPTECLAIQYVVKRCVQYSKIGKKRKQGVLAYKGLWLSFTFLNLHFNIYTHLFSQARDGHCSLHRKTTNPPSAPSVVGPRVQIRYVRYTPHCCSEHSTFTNWRKEFFHFIKK